jgi:hypothetical protein
MVALPVAEPVAADVAVPVTVCAPPTPRHVIEERHAALLRHGVPVPGDTDEPVPDADDTPAAVAVPGTRTMAVPDADAAAALVAVPNVTFSPVPDATDAPADVAGAMTRASAVVDPVPAAVAVPDTICNPAAVAELSAWAVATYVGSKPKIRVRPASGPLEASVYVKLPAVPPETSSATSSWEASVPALMSFWTFASSVPDPDHDPVGALLSRLPPRPIITTSVVTPVGPVTEKLLPAAWSVMAPAFVTGAVAVDTPRSTTATTPMDRLAVPLPVTEMAELVVFG